MMSPTGIAFAATVLVMLAWASARGEEPAPAPAAVAGPETSAPGEEARALRGYGPSPGSAFVEYAFKEILLGLLALAFFLAGLWQHRHDWKPLIIGLFACALGLLDASMLLGDGLVVIAGTAGRPAGAYLAESLARSLISFNVGLVALMAGGLFTLILHSRNERMRKEASPPDDAKAAAQDQD